MESAVARARLAVIKIISENNFIHDENMNKVSHFPELHTEHPNYALVKREKGRCFARATAAMEAITRAKAQLAKLPCSSFEWMRLPMSRNQGIDDIDELQAHLVCLEDKLREGKVIYIYSSEGHGRSGLLTACLLGRLYRLSSPEALYRIQACHDSRSAELSREQVVHCPSSASQRQCVQIILGESDGIGNGTVLRAGDQKSRTKDSMAEMIQRQREYNLFAGNSLPSNRDEIGPMGPLVLQRLPA